jgi:uncharacterized membrane protein
MIGFLIGTACLIGLVATLKRGRGFHGRWRHGRGGRYGGWGARAALRALFVRLDTSPGQEKVIAGVLEDLWTTKREVGEEFIQTRRDVARAMQGTTFDEAALSDAFARQDALLAKLRETMKTALATVHEALDDRQRKTAGSLIASGGLFMRGGACRGRYAEGRGRFDHDHDHDRGHGPYRSASV